MYDLRRLSSVSDLFLGRRVLALLVALVPLNAAARITPNTADYGFSFTGGGTSYTAGPVGPGPVNTSPSVGSPAPNRVGPLTFTTDNAGNPVVTTNQRLPLPSGSGSLPVDVSAPVSRPSAGAALAKFAKVVGPIATAMALYDLLTDLNITPIWHPDEKENKFLRQTMTTQCEITGGSQVQFFCGAFPGTTSFLSPQGYCQGAAVCAAQHTCQTPSGPFSSSVFCVSGVNVPEGRLITEQALAQLIAEKSGWPSKWNDALGDAVRAGQSVQHGTPRVTGPSTVQGPARTSTTAGPQGSGTVTNETIYNVTYNNNQVTYNTTNITNETRPDGTTATTTTTTAEPEVDDPCKANPGTVGCTELGEAPDGEVPRTTRNVTFAEENPFGGGSCPGNRTVTINGRTITVAEWSRWCPYIADYLRPLLIAMASFMALLIVAGVRTETA